MPRRLRFAVVVFVVTLIVNVAVQTVWPDGEVDWSAAIVISLVTALAISVIEQRPRRRD